MAKLVPVKISSMAKPKVFPRPYSRENSPIKALVFDAYGTLFDVGSVVKTLNRKFPGKGAAMSAEWRAKQLQYTWVRSLSGRYEDFWKVTESALIYTCNEMKLPCDVATRAELMDSYLHLDPFPEVIGALKSLSGYRLAILSNGTLNMLQAVVESAGLKGVFSQVISVDEVKIYKPSPAVYELAVRKLGVEKSDIGFVSSNFWDAAGGKSFGFRSYWVNRTDAPVDELGATPDTTLRLLSELFDAVMGD
jgi:2-haloacid dehalogenase